MTPHLIALTGLAGSGKSTAAAWLAEHHGFVRTRFAAPLKDMLRALGLGEAEIEGHLKEVPSPLLGGHTPRHAMQTLGTEWGRAHMGADFWVGLWSRIAADVLDQGGKVVVEDCRFRNEAAAARALGGVVIGLTGRGGTAGTGHVSEAAAVTPDLVVANGGSIETLQRRLSLIAERPMPA